MNKKRYWLRFGSVFFFILLAISLYASSIIEKNEISVYPTGQSQPFNINDYWHFIPGLNSLVNFAYISEPLGLFVGSVILSILYGLLGAVLGWFYGKIKNQNSSSN